MRKHISGLVFGLAMSVGFATQATVLDVFNSNDLSNAFGTIDTIDTAQTGAQHYNFFSASGHPSGVPLGDQVANMWVHQDTNNPGQYSFGFIFSQDNSGVPTNNALVNFRIVGSDTAVFISQGDEAVEVSQPTADTFLGDFTYSNNSDGIMLSGISGADWTIIIDSVTFGDITSWNAASGDSNHLALTLGDEYRITLQDNAPSTAAIVPSPGAVAIFGLGLVGLVFARRRA